MILIKLIKNDIYRDFVNLRHQKGLSLNHVAKGIGVSVDELEALELNISSKNCYKYRKLAYFYNKKIAVRLEDKQNVKS